MNKSQTVPDEFMPLLKCPGLRHTVYTVRDNLLEAAQKIPEDMINIELVMDKGYGMHAYYMVNKDIGSPYEELFTYFAVGILAREGIPCVRLDNEDPHVDKLSKMGYDGEILYSPYSTLWERYPNSDELRKECHDNANWRTYKSNTKLLYAAFLRIGSIPSVTKDHHGETVWKDNLHDNFMNINKGLVFDRSGIYHSGKLVGWYDKDRNVHIYCREGRRIVTRTKYCHSMEGLEHFLKQDVNRASLSVLENQCTMGCLEMGEEHFDPMPT